MNTRWVGATKCVHPSHTTSQTLSDAAAKPPPKTLRQKFKGQKAFAGIGFLLSALVLVTAFFHSGACWFVVAVGCMPHCLLS